MSGLGDVVGTETRIEFASRTFVLPTMTIGDVVDFKAQMRDHVLSELARAQQKNGLPVETLELLAAKELAWFAANFETAVVSRFFNDAEALLLMLLIRARHKEPKLTREDIAALPMWELAMHGSDIMDLGYSNLPELKAKAGEGGEKDPSPKAPGGSQATEKDPPAKS